MMMNNLVLFGCMWWMFSESATSHSLNEKNKMKNTRPTTTNWGWSKNDDLIEGVILKNGQGLTAEVITYGATLVKLTYRGTSMIQSFTSLSEVEADETFAGATIGRVCNRIRDAKYGDFQLSANEGRHQLHGGKYGWDKRLWTITEASETKVTMEYDSAHGEQGFPSRVKAVVSYELASTTLRVVMKVTNTGNVDTVSNMTPHPYFDLGGNNGISKNSVLPYTLYSPSCCQFLELDTDGIPTGKITPTKDTPFDMSSETTIRSTGNIDNYFVCSIENGSSRKAHLLTLKSPSGVQLLVSSDQPGFQLYTPPDFSSVAIEPSQFIDAPNNPHFPTIDLAPGMSRIQRTDYSFY